MKQVFNFGGSVIVEEIDPPVCDDNSILVQNLYSAISIGTEKTSISKKKETSLLKRLLNKENLKKGFEMVRNKGLQKTLKVVKDTGELFLVPMGYSTAGRVISVGKNVDNFTVGDLVACAGGGYATHAEIINVPKNLACKIPEKIDLKEAAFTTIGAIALQGVRRANVTLGETIVVYGIGLLGQLTSQILKAAGCTVIALDLLEERLKLAKKNGVDLILNPTKNDIEKEVLNYTQRHGADAVIICASTPTNEIIDQAMNLCRVKGRIVIVGDVGLDLKRDLMYAKELDILISTSYGPGRYDKEFEEKGHDYPIGYVRWTENRNMIAFLGLLKNQKLNLNEIIEYEFGIDNAPRAYNIIKTKNPLGVVIRYEDEIIEEKKLQRKTILRKEKAKGKLKIVVIGAGTFAKSYHLPNISKLNYCSIEAIISNNPVNALNTAKKFNARITGTDFNEILDEKLDLVIITTRHNTHAEMAIAFAKKKVDILVEKPIALNLEDCNKIASVVKKNNVELAVGFNRRFAPLSQIAKEIIEKRNSPLLITYRINSANMTKDHWINDPKIGGGAILGEGVHFFDYCHWLVSSKPKEISAKSISSINKGITDANNIISMIKYEDGSLASITYTTEGNNKFSKERIEIYYENKVIIINDFKEIEFHGINEKNIQLKSIDKGHDKFIEAYTQYLIGKRDAKDLPLIDDGIEATKTAIKILEKIKKE